MIWWWTTWGHFSVTPTNCTASKICVAFEYMRMRELTYKAFGLQGGSGASRLFPKLQLDGKQAMRSELHLSSGWFLKFRQSQMQLRWTLIKGWEFVGFLASGWRNQTQPCRMIQIFTGPILKSLMSSAIQILLDMLRQQRPTFEEALMLES